MVNLRIERSARHLLIAPNRSLDDGMIRAHNCWLSAIVLVLSLVCLLAGLWPIAVVLIMVLFGLLYVLLQVAEMLKLEEHLIIDSNQLSFRRGRELLVSGDLSAAARIYVNSSHSVLAPLKFELVVPQRPSLSFARDICQKDSITLLKSLKRCGINVIELSSQDQRVKSF